MTGGGTLTGTLAAATPANCDISVNSGGPMCIVIKNTGGSNAIGTVTVSKSPQGTQFAVDTTITIASIAAGASVLVELGISAASIVRITMTSASGSTYAVEWRHTGVS